jgi:hypothetical protein
MKIINWNKGNWVTRRLLKILNVLSIIYGLKNKKFGFWNYVNLFIFFNLLKFDYSFSLFYKIGDTNLIKVNLTIFQ